MHQHLVYLLLSLLLAASSSAFVLPPARRTYLASWNLPSLGGEVILSTKAEIEAAM
jgi:hypothetical protein